MTNSLKIIINVFSGSALIVGGCYLLSASMGALAEKGAKGFSRRFKTPLGAFFASCAITSAVQSSAAVTVMTVSMANAGVLSLAAAMAAVYGANIGTTVTVQIMTLDISSFGQYILLGGALLYAAERIAGRRGTPAKAAVGLGMLFTGLNILKAGAIFIKSSDYIMNFISQYGENAFWCVLFGFITTALIQSSSATVGLTIAMFAGGVLDFKQAVLITLGDNIGTCVTAQTAAITGSDAGRRVAWGNMLYNIVCAFIAFVFIEPFTSTVLYITGSFGQSEANLVANAHTVLNIFGAAFFMPLNRSYCRLLERFFR